MGEDPQRFVRTELLLDLMEGEAPVDYQRFREDVDAHVDQDLTPRS